MDALSTTEESVKKKWQPMLLVATIDGRAPFDVKSKMTIGHGYLNKLR
jgi:hypothetical protein